MQFQFHLIEKQVIDSMEKEKKSCQRKWKESILSLLLSKVLPISIKELRDAVFMFRWKII